MISKVVKACKQRKNRKEKLQLVLGDGGEGRQDYVGLKWRLQWVQTEMLWKEMILKAPTCTPVSVFAKVLLGLHKWDYFLTICIWKPTTFFYFYFCIQGEQCLNLGALVLKHL